MEISGNKQKERIENTLQAVKKILLYFSRWMYILVLVAVIAFSYFIWNKNVQNAEWSDEQKRNYINQQAVFSFNQAAFQKSVDFYKAKQERLKSDQKFSGKDIFFPPGF